jgi:tetratricopeptide (TPR) repeat protein
MMMRHPAMAHPVDTDSVHTLRTRPGFAVPWEGARRLLAQLRIEMGDAPIDRALDPCRGLLSLVLRELDQSLTRKERRDRDQHSALHLASLLLIEPSARSLAEAWAEAFASLLERRRVVVVIPDCASLDRETLYLVRPLLRRTADQGHLRLILGYDPRPRSESVKRLTLEPIMGELRLFAALDGTEEHIILNDTQSSGEISVAAAAFSIDPLDDELEWDAWQALRTREPKAPLGDLALRGVQRACECFGFAEALEVAEALRTRELDSDQSAELHYLAGLAAACAGSSQELAQLSKNHLSAALTHTHAPARRAAILSHLSNVSPSRELADQMLAVARNGNLPPAQAVHFAIAAQHARSQASYGEDRVDAAATECQSALDLLAGGKRGLELSDVERALVSWNLLADHIRFAFESGDIESAMRSEQLRSRCKAMIPAFRMPLINWLPAPLFDADPETAAQQFTKRKAEARAALQPDAEAFWSYLVGELYYRIGDAELALENFATAFELWVYMHHDAEDVLAAQLGCAVAALRANRPGEAESRFQSLHSHPLLSHNAGRAETLGALAMAAARRGDEECALHRISAAFAQAAICPEPDVLVGVNRSAGETYRILGQFDESRAAFEQALAASSGYNAIAPSEIFCLLVGAPTDTARTIEALLLITQALDDGNAWWELPRLIPRVTKLAERGELSRHPRANDLALAVRCLVEAGSQRPDCRDAVMELVLAVIESPTSGVAAR